MDKPEHTPGPWRIEHNGPFAWGIYGADGRFIAQTVPAFDDGRENSPDECEANAHLLGAADTMLAALRAINERLNELALAARKPNVRDLNDFQRWSAAAIAKAEGR